LDGSHLSLGPPKVDIFNVEEHTDQPHKKQKTKGKEVKEYNFLDNFDKNL